MFFQSGSSLLSQPVPNQPSYSLYPTINHSNQALLTHFIHNMNTLSQQVLALTSKVASLQQQLARDEAEEEEAVMRRTAKKRERTFVMVRKHTGRMEKVFTKHLRCKVGQCKKRYSSQIALNKHVRVCHGDEVVE